jgi:hypothetical protein
MRPGFQTFLDIRAALRPRNDQSFFASLRMTSQSEITWIASDPPAATRFRKRI